MILMTFVGRVAIGWVGEPDAAVQGTMSFGELRTSLEITSDDLSEPSRSQRTTH
jgi:hypothetical protein